MTQPGDGMRPGRPLKHSPDVLFLVGCWDGESKRYRVYNLVEGLESRGYSSEVVDFFKIRDVINQGLKPKVAVFFRAPFDPSVGIIEALDYFRQNKVLTVYDVDDYVFEPKIIPYIAGVALLDEAEKNNYDWGVRAYRSLMFCCDRVTVPTQYLVDRLLELGRDAYLIKNSINSEQRLTASMLLDRVVRSTQDLRIGYFSGSRTHNRDFAVCASAIQEILRNNPDVIFRLVGLLDLDESWLPFAERIERYGLMGPIDMLARLSECDINLVPLEEDNAFCAGKSELKFFEAGLVRVPTVASRTATFASTIQDDVTGFLASTPEEWETKLQALIDSPERRREIGASARAAALSNFSVEAVTRSAVAAYGFEPPASVTQSTDNPLKIGWIVPGLIIGGGGHRNILRAAHHLERFGHDVRLYFIDTPMKEGELRRAIRDHFYPFEGRVELFRGDINDEDILIATHWSTVAPAESVADQVGEILYFVQDFEPAFYPMGSEYIMAENTYRKGLYAISSGPWCENLLRKDYGMEVDHFRFPIERSIYYLRPDVKRANRIIFFAKPEMPRRCFLIGVQALRELHRRRPDIEITFFGSGSDIHGVDFPITVGGLRPGLSDLADLYASSAMGMVFSTTNPSLVPYEMMACGLPVVDLGRPGNEINYDNRFDIALLADPNPVRMAEQIDYLLKDKAELEARSQRGLAFTAMFPTEEEMARRIEALIMARVRPEVMSIEPWAGYIRQK